MEKELLDGRVCQPNVGADFPLVEAALSSLRHDPKPESLEAMGNPIDLTMMNMLLFRYLANTGGKAVGDIPLEAMDTITILSRLKPITPRA